MFNQSKKIKTVAIIAAGGSGKRMLKKNGKQFIKIAGRPMLHWTLDAFNKSGSIDAICLVLGKGDMHKAPALRRRFKKILYVAAGGSERQVSVYNGINAITMRPDVLIVHDGARPFLTNKMINDSIRSALKYGSGVAGVPLKDTIKKVFKDRIVNTPERKQYCAIQTPQAFRYALLLKAYANARGKRIRATDDAALVEKISRGVRIIEGSYANIKITTRHDLLFAEYIVKNRNKYGE